MSASETEFLKLWDESLARFCVDDLMPAGQETALLQPLAGFPRAAERLVRRASLCDDQRQRQCAAILLGYMSAPPDGLLDELFERESERSAAASPESLEPLRSQSVVEDIVLAASRQCRIAALREPACALLRKVVERTLVGEYWNTAAFALTTLCQRRAAHASDLLVAFARFARGSPPDHPSNPSLATERRFVDALQSAGGDSLCAIEDRLDRQEREGAGVVFEFETQQVVDRWLELARELG